MAYNLSLTPGEREALSWVGHRDWTGDPIFTMLWSDAVLWDGNDQRADIDFDGMWRGPNTITFTLPEHKAWELREMWEEAGETIPHLAPEFAAKLLGLFDSIV